MKFIKKYQLEVLLLLLQLTPLSTLAILIASMYIFYVVAFKKRLDFVSLFLLLLPSIALKGSEEVFRAGLNQYEQESWFQIYLPYLKNEFVLGPLAITPRLFAVLAVPFRVLKNINHQKNIFLLLLWIVSLGISIIGLYIAYHNGIKSPGGITIGLRIVLSLGVLFFPLAIKREEFNKQIMLIMKISLFLFITGLLVKHWIFVMVAFPAVILFSNENKFWRILSFFIIVILLLGGFTFTIKLTVLFSIVLIFVFSNKALKNSKLKNSKIIAFFILVFPVVVVYLTINHAILPSLVNFINVQHFYSKLFHDRGGIWLYTIELIKNSNFFIVPSGRNIPTWNYGIKGFGEWGAGAHDIYLEMMRQIGVFASLLLFIIISKYLWVVFKKLYYFKNTTAKFILSLFAVYLVFGLTGNDLIYDGVGFLFWLIIGQLYYLSFQISLNENLTSFSSRRIDWSRESYIINT